MPNIRPYEQQTGASGQIPGRTATADDFGGQIGESLYGLGQAGIRAVKEVQAEDERRRVEQERLRNKQKQDELLKGQVEIAKGRSQWLLWLDEESKKAPADAAGFTKRFNDEFTKYKDAALDSMTLPETKTAYEASLEGLRATLLDNAVRFESGARAQAKVNSVREGFAANENAVRADPALLPDVLAQDKQLLASMTGALPAAKLDELAIERSQKIYGATADGSLSALIAERHTPGLRSFLENLKTGDWKNRLSAPDYERVLSQTQQAIRVLESADAQALRDLVAERVRERASGTNNGLSVAEAAGDPKAARAITSAIEIGDARNAVKSVPFSEMVALANGAQERLATSGNYDADASYAEALGQAIRERAQAFAADPAGYTIQNVPAVAQAFQAMRDAQFSPDAVADYRTRALSAQKDLGAPHQLPKLLPKSMTDMLVAEISSLPAEQVADRMEVLQKQYAPMWGEVLGELQAAKVRPEYVTLGRLTDPRQAHVRVALAEALKSDEIIRKNLAETDAKDIDAAVEAAMQPYARTLAHLGANGQAALRGEIRSAQQLAYLYRMQGASVNDAAKKAANGLIFDYYDTEGSYLAPKGKMGLAESNARHVMRTTPIENFPEAAGGDANLSPEYRRKAEYNAAQRGHWVNVTDPVGGRLGIEWLKEDGTPVILKDGTRVRLYFDDLTALPLRQSRGREGYYSETPGGAVTGIGAQ